MKTSDNIAELAQALCNLQGEVKDVHKGAKAHNYNYADLGAVLQLIRPLMSTHGLSLVQMPCGDGVQVGITSRLMHNSGEWVEDTLMMGITESRGMSMAQAAGSVLTYCRRYSAAAILGITQVDQDAAVQEPVVVPASTDLIAVINDYIAAGQISKRRESWIYNNINNMTHAQATTIINECKEQSHP